MYRIVLSGGPCSGKSSALEEVRRHFVKKGIDAQTVTETATELISEGKDPTGATAVPFHAELIRRQIAKEDRHEGCDLLICDRGAPDIKAYLTEGQYEEVLRAAGCSDAELRGRYHAVYHLVTAAIGAEDAYSLSNNAARSESPEYAREVDGRTREVWKNHPVYHVIDNSTDFKGKIERLIKLIESDLYE